jgi:S-formylglutathione hydrolase FrmB
MNIDLFGQSLLVCLSVFSFASLTILLLKINKRMMLRLLGYSLLLSFILQIITGVVTTSKNEIPSQFWLMMLPFSLSTCLLFFTRLSRKDKKISAKKLWKSRSIYLVDLLAIVSCFFLGLILLNGYYRDYPTLYSALGIYQSSGTLNSSGQVILQFNPTNESAANHQTVESIIDGNNSNPTNGKLYQINIPGKVSGFKARSGWLYEPAIAVKDGNTLNLPVLVLLAGLPGNPTDWLHGVQLVSTMDEFAKEHHGITPLVFVVDDIGSPINDTECVNSPRGNVETYLTTDVPKYIENNYPASDNPANWGIGGLSLGGTCAVMLALTHPNVYHYFLDMGGDLGPSIGTKQETIQKLYGGNEAAWAADQPSILLKTKTYKNVGGYFANGREDSPDVVNGTSQLYTESKNAGLDTVYETVDGQHTFDVFDELFSNALPWLSNRIGATNCSGTTTCT